MVNLNSKMYKKTGVWKGLCPVFLFLMVDNYLGIFLVSPPKSPKFLPGDLFFISCIKAPHVETTMVLSPKGWVMAEKQKLEGGFSKHFCGAKPMGKSHDEYQILEGHGSLVCWDSRWLFPNPAIRAMATFTRACGESYNHIPCGKRT